jgi:hypothetical protein
MGDEYVGLTDKHGRGPQNVPLLHEISKLLVSLIMTLGPRWPRRRCQLVEEVVETRPGGEDASVEEGRSM